MPLPTRTVTFENGETYDDVPISIKTYKAYTDWQETKAENERGDEFYRDPERLTPPDVDNPFRRDLKRIYRGAIGQPLDFARAALTSGDLTVGEKMEEIRETRATELSEMEKAGQFSYRSLLYPDQEEQDLIVDEDGYAVETETAAGLGLNLASYLVGGYGVARGLSRLALKSPKAFKALTSKYKKTSTFLYGTNIGVLTDQWISNPNAGNIVSMFADDTGVSDAEINVLGEYIKREETLAQKLTPREEDSDFEKRFKNIVGNLPIDFVVGIGGVGMYAWARKKGKLPKELNADDKVEIVKSGLNATRKEAIPPTTQTKINASLEVEDADELRQIVNQEDSFLGWRKLKQRFFTTRGYNSMAGQDAFESSLAAQRKIDNRAEHATLRLKNSIDNVIKDTGDTETSERVMDFLNDSRTIIVRDKKSLTSEFEKGEFKIIGERQQRETKLMELLKSDKISDEKKISLISKKYNLDKTVAANALESRLLIDDVTSKIMNDSSIDPKIKRKLQANLGLYLRKSYKLFEDENYKASKPARDKALRFLRNKIRRTEKEYAKATDSQIENAAEARLDTLLDEAQREFRPRTAKGKLQAPIFKTRKNIPDPIREVMGEIEDPVDSLVLTVNKMSKFYQRDQFLKDMNLIGTKQKWLLKAGDTKPALGGGKEWVEITGSGNKKLNGKFTTPLMKRVLDDQEQYLFGEGYSDNTFVKNFLSVKGFANKAATVFNHITGIRNVLGGVQASIANGLNPFKLTGEATGWRTFKTIKNEISRGGDKKLEELYEEYLGLGIINTNVRIGDFRALINTGADASSVDNLAAKIKNIPYAGKAVARVGELAEDTYMGVDDYFKINGFEQELAFLKRAHGSSRDIASLKKEAAETIKNTYFNYDRVSKGVKSLRQSPLGSFASFPAEVIRTSGHIVAQGTKEFISGNAVLATRGAMRLAGFGGSGYAWAKITEATAANMGWSEAQQEAAQVLTETPYSKVSSKIWRKDEETGQIFSADTKYIDAYNTIKEPLLLLIADAEQGRITGEDIPERILEASFVALKELASPFLSEAIFTNTITDLYYAYRNPNGETPDGKSIFPIEQEPLQRATNAVGYALDNLVPGSSNSIERLIDANRGAVNPYTGLPKYDLNTEILANVSGTRFSEFNPKEQVEFAITNYRREERKLKTVRGDYASPMEKTLNEYSTRQRNRYELQQELFRKIKAAQYFINDNNLRNLFKERNMPRDFSRNILDGMFTPETVTDSLLKSVSERSVLEEGVTFRDIRLKFRERYSIMTYTNLHMPEEKEEDDVTSDTRPNYDKGGSVTVPQAPEEPDQRIDKMTGLPYDQQAGGAFVDEEDRLEFAAGGKVLGSLGRVSKREGGVGSKVKKKVINAVGKLFGIGPQEQRDNEKAAIAAVNQAVENKKLPASARIPTDVSGLIDNKRSSWDKLGSSEEVFNAINHGLLSYRYGTNPVTRAALQVKEKIQGSSRENPISEEADAFNNHFGYTLRERGLNEQEALQEMVNAYDRTNMKLMLEQPLIQGQDLIFNVNDLQGSVDPQPETLGQMYTGRIERNKGGKVLNSLHRNCA